ncbi:hypothetical protein chiPu_0024374 [Chiloscyllium punctatum]|uniref:Uncharacterized protein n=1 Tax=Chiloscyllium punctatum TaxID=137246 RepID=A0A401TC43_CHIPU|nr:hypothetical protein [Chiloscyllium punctatum]
MGFRPQPQGQRRQLHFSSAARPRRGAHSLERAGSAPNLRTARPHRLHRDREPFPFEAQDKKSIDQGLMPREATTN